MFVPDRRHVRELPRIGGPVVTTGYANTSLVIKVGYYVLAAGVAVFVAMLILTAYS